MTGALLRLDDVHAYYADSHVLQGVSFDVGAGEVVSLLGRNGAGKTTTLKSVMGIVRPRRGRVVLGGRELGGWPIHQVARAGVAYVPETRDVFPSLSVRENLALGTGGDGEWTLERVLALFPQLAGLLSRPGATLSRRRATNARRRPRARRQSTLPTARRAHGRAGTSGCR